VMRETAVVEGRVDNALGSFTKGAHRGPPPKWSSGAAPAVAAAAPRRAARPLAFTFRPSAPPTPAGSKDPAGVFTMIPES
jgi:hypothetical protein